MKTVRLTTAQAIVRYLAAQRTVLDGEDAALIALNAARFDATKHGALPPVADAREALAELDGAPHGWGAVVDTTDDLGEAVEQARSADRTSLIALRTAPGVWTEGGAFWEVGLPAESDREEVWAARAELLEAKQRERVGW